MTAAGLSLQPCSHAATSMSGDGELRWPRNSAPAEPMPSPRCANCSTRPRHGSPARTSGCGSALRGGSRHVTGAICQELWRPHPGSGTRPATVRCCDAKYYHGGGQWGCGQRGEAGANLSPSFRFHSANLSLLPWRGSDVSVWPARHWQKPMASSPHLRHFLSRNQEPYSPPA